MSCASENGSVGAMCGTGSTDGKCGGCWGFVAPVLQQLERGGNDGPLGQLLARRGVLGVLFGAESSGGQDKGVHMAGRVVEGRAIECGRCGACGVREFQVEAFCCENGGTGLSVSVDRLRDVGGAEGFYGQGSEASRFRAGIGSLDGGVDGKRWIAGKGVAAGKSEASTQEIEGWSGSVGVRDEIGNVPEVENVPVDSGSKSVSDVEDRKKARKEKNRRRKDNKRARILGGQKGSGNCGSGASPVSSWRRGALSETVPGLTVKSVPSVSGLSSSVDVSRGYFAEIDKDERIKLRESRARMLVIQNELAMLRAEREIKVLEATDIEVEKRKYLTSVRAATERNMVSIEKTHASLVATDNVPRVELDHDVHTVLTGDVPDLSSGSISPNSSASMAEFRACQKENLDHKATIEHMVKAFKKLGVSEATIPYIGKEDWTINSQGTLDEVAHDALAELMPGGYAIQGSPYLEKGDKVGVMPVGHFGFD